MTSPSLFDDITEAPVQPQVSARPTRRRPVAERIADYDAFVAKFETPKTTDDCYTPPYIYDCIRRWVDDCVVSLDGYNIVRPFVPGGDYQAFEYQDDDIVLDNPPFSILAEIRRWYQAHGVKYFLFGPSLTLFSTPLPGETYIAASAPVKYENGAVVRTSFITNLTPGIRIHLAGDLYKRADAARCLHEAETHVELPVYRYPDSVISAALMTKVVERGICLDIAENEAHFIRALDAQRTVGKAIFGGGYLLSEAAEARWREAQREARAEARAEVWKLSPRELEIQRRLGKSNG